MPEDLPTPRQTLEQLEARKKAGRPLALPPGAVSFVPTKDLSTLIYCPICDHPQLRIGIDPCICGYCDEEWSPIDLATLIGSSGPYTCPACKELAMASKETVALCCACGQYITDAHLVCTNCSNSVPLSDLDRFEEDRMCGACAGRAE